MASPDPCHLIVVSVDERLSNIVNMTQRNIHISGKSAYETRATINKAHMRYKRVDERASSISRCASGRVEVPVQRL